VSTVWLGNSIITALLWAFFPHKYFGAKRLIDPFSELRGGEIVPDQRKIGLSILSSLVL
jgi:hypothetical protein